MTNVIHLIPPGVASKAIGLYALLDYNFSDFHDACMEAQPQVLKILLLMLLTPNPKHDMETIRLNAAGAEHLRSIAQRRNLTIEDNQNDPDGSPRADIDAHKNQLINPMEMLHWTWLRVIINTMTDDEWNRVVEKAAEVLAR